MVADQVRFGPFLLDLARKELTRGGAPVQLGSRSLDILCALAAAKGELVTKDRLMAVVWAGSIVEENAIQVHVSSLRRVIDDARNGTSHVVTVPGRGYRFLPAIRPTAAGTGGGEAPALPDKPSIAVLPFSNLSGEPEQEYFAEGIAEDIITALARARWFFVIARNSSFTFKADAVRAEQVARELGVRYVLKGSVRRSGDRIRIAAQLIDAQAGIHVWGERYDRNLQDLFAVQDDITERVAGAIEP